MDGINGMSGLYSLVILGSLLYINESVIQFTQQDFIIYPLLASLVFLFFNFRKKDKFFMGDVGSMGIAFWVIALVTLLIIETEQLKYILLLTVYGVEVTFTIMERLLLKENIFEAHRRHLYQLLANEKKISHLVISAVYAFIQLLVNLFIINFECSDILSFFIVITILSAMYLLTKRKIKKELAKA
jgi:UDP-N-acetylmuramyl pentapeptide phosphotransferase/UDP-N-acetylglucosamine-1-phosphate transferase